MIQSPDTLSPGTPKAQMTQSIQPWWQVAQPHPPPWSIGTQGSLPRLHLLPSAHNSVPLSPLPSSEPLPTSVLTWEESRLNPETATLQEPGKRQGLGGCQGNHSTPCLPTHWLLGLSVLLLQ